MLSNIDHYGKPRLPKGDEFSEKFQKVFVYVYWRGGPGGAFKIHRLFLVQRLEVIFSIITIIIIMSTIIVTIATLFRCTRKACFDIEKGERGGGWGELIWAMPKRKYSF